MKKLLKKDNTQGFTLLELLVAILFLTALVLIILPNYLNQAGKARSAEARQVLGVINRVQQAYRFEQGTFASTVEQLSTYMSVGSIQGSSLATNYFNYRIQAGASSDEVHHLAQPQAIYANDTRQLTSAVYRRDTGITLVVCQAYDVFTTPQILNPDTCLDGEILR